LKTLMSMSSWMSDISKIFLEWAMLFWFWFITVWSLRWMQNSISWNKLATKTYRIWTD